ncbi:MAG: hypothetical protein QW728_07445 [Thermoplasmata archaeon]
MILSRKKIGFENYKEKAVVDIPLQLVIIAIVATISIAAIVVGLYYYSVSQANANAEHTVETIESKILEYAGETGSDKILDVSVKGALFSSVEYIEIGDTLKSPSEQPTGYHGFLISWKVSGGDRQSREIVSDAGRAIQVTGQTHDVAENEASWPNPIKSSDNWGLKLRLVEGDYRLKLKIRTWDPGNLGTSFESFVLIYFFW